MENASFDLKLDQLPDHLPFGDSISKLIELIERIERNGENVTARQLMRASREFRNSADDATAALQGLVDSDLGEWVTSKPDSQGGQPTKAFRLAVSIADTGDGDRTPICDPASGGSVTVTSVTAPGADDWGEL